MRTGEDRTWVDRALAVGAVVGLGAAAVGFVVAVAEDSGGCTLGGGFCSPRDAFYLIAIVGFLVGVTCSVISARR